MLLINRNGVPLNRDSPGLDWWTILTLFIKEPCGIMYPADGRQPGLYPLVEAGYLLREYTDSAQWVSITPAGRAALAAYREGNHA